MVDNNDLNQVVSKILTLRPDIELLSRLSGADGDYTIRVKNPVTNEMVVMGVSGVDYDVVEARASGIFFDIKDAVSAWPWTF